jgi:hypothetical protein
MNPVHDMSLNIDYSVRMARVSTACQIWHSAHMMCYFMHNC